MESLEEVSVGDVRCLVRPRTSDRAAFEENLQKQPFLKHSSVAKGSCWVDCGAYIGTFALFLLKNGANVLSVEPDPESAACYESNIKLNGFSTKLIRAAVLQAALEKKVAFYRGSSSRGRVNHWGNSTINRWKRPVEKISVPTISFLELVSVAKKHFKAKELCLKLDVEGAEISILEKADFSCFRQIYFEYHFHSDPTVERALAVLERLGSLGFEVKTDRKLPAVGEPLHWQQSIFLGWATRK